MPPSTPPTNLSLPDWLNSLDLGHYAANFADNDITPDILPGCTDITLQQCGISSLEDRNTILAAIEALASQFPAIPAASGSATVTTVAKNSPGAQQKQPSPGPILQNQGREETIRKPPLLDRLGGRFLYVSIIAHVVFGLIATWFVVQRIEAKRKLTFQAGGKANNPNQRALEHKVKVTKQMKTMSAPAQSKRITTTAVSARVAIPEITMPMTNDAAPSRMAGAGSGVVGFGTASMAGSAGGGGAGAGGIPFFGLRTNKGGLVGQLYDLKQTPDLKPTDMAAVGVELSDPMPAPGWGKSAETTNYRETLVHFVKSSWNPSILGRFYKAPNQLVTTQFFIPALLAAEAPKAFGVEKIVAARRWVIHYSGTVIPPKSGRFRFVGFGDDILMVRMNGRTVLDANLWSQRVQPELGKPIYDKPPEHGPVLLAGPWFELHAGERAKMEVLIGEGPGGHFVSYLFIDEQAANNPVGDYAVFQLKDSPLPDLAKAQRAIQNFTGKTLVFKADDAPSIFSH